MSPLSRRDFLHLGQSLAAGAAVGRMPALASVLAANENPVDYSLTIATTPVEIARGKFLSLTTYNGQFPGPLLPRKMSSRPQSNVYKVFEVIAGVLAAARS